MLHVTAVRALGGTRPWLRFDDGQEGDVDLGPELEEPAIIPLRDPAASAEVAVDPDAHTVAWPNGADFAPGFLAGLLGQRAAASRGGRRGAA